MEVLRLANVGLDYPGQPAVLDGVNLLVRRGEMQVLMGRSGSGKSSILSLASGLRSPTRGRVGLLGRPYPKDADRVAQLRKDHIGLVFQHLHLIPELTVRENIELPLRLRHAPRKARSDRAQRLMETFDLSSLADALPRRMSGGEQQRCAIARALAPSPDLLLVDEPTSALDRENAQTVIASLQKARGEGAAILVVTHDNLFQSVGPVSRLEGGRLQTNE